MSAAGRKGEILEKYHKEEIQRLQRERDEERARFQDENANLKAERDQFRRELGVLRSEKAALETELDEAKCTISDLKFNSRRNPSPSVASSVRSFPATPRVGSADTNSAVRSFIVSIITHL